MARALFLTELDIAREKGERRELRKKIEKKEVRSKKDHESEITGSG